MFDVRTTNFDLALPDHRNPLKFDVERLIQSLTKIDEIMSGFGGILTGMTGVMLDYSLSTLPDDSWRFCDGKALLESDQKAARLHSKLLDDGCPYGSDDFGNPKVPDYRGRASVGKDDMGGAPAGRVTHSGSGINGNELGATGGMEIQTLTMAQIPRHGHDVTDGGHSHKVTDSGHSHTVSDAGHSHGITDPGHSHSSVYRGGSGASSNIGPVSASSRSSNTWLDYTSQVIIGQSTTGVSIQHAASGVAVSESESNVNMQSAEAGISISETGSDEPHNNMQPSIVANKIIKL